MYKWPTSELPKPNNGFMRNFKQMNAFGLLPFPMNKVSSFYKRKIIKGLKNVDCDISFGFNTLFGNLYGGFVSFNDCYILDYAPIFFGDQVLIGPGCKLITSWHPADNLHEVRAKEISIGDNVWLTMNIIVLPGVSIGNNSIIGAGSIVTKSIPSDVIAAGNPAHVIRGRI